MARKRKLRKNRISYTILSLAGILILAGLFVGISAKYVHQESKMSPLASEKFYFTSDVLSETGNSYTLADNATEITFELRNYADDLRWSDSALSYNYSVTDTTNKEVAKGNGTITYNNSQKSAVTITISKLSAGTYTITASSERPYKKTLTGTFTIPEESTEISYSINDNTGSPYALLTVSTQNYDGNISINWPEGVIPDSTQDAFAKISTYENGNYKSGSVTVKMQKYFSNTYRFFKVNSSNQYSKEQITATKAQ